MIFNEKESEEFKKRVWASYDVGMEKMRQFYRNMSNEKRLEEIRLVEDDGLLWLCEVVAMPTEDYEICATVYIVLRERGLI